MGNQYKKIIFALINNLTMAHHSPGQKVVTQNENIHRYNEEEGEWQFKNDDDEKNHVFFIMTGYYVVLTMQFDTQHKFLTLSKDDEGCKRLKQGDLFGELSVIFGCERTASVKAKQYCEAAYIKNVDFNQLLVNHPIVKKYFISRIMREYDDEQRVFLMQTLKKIDYL